MKKLSNLIFLRSCKMINDVDCKVLQFIDEFKVARFKTLSSLYYSSDNTARRRLKQLVDCKELKRDRHSFIDEYIYFKKQGKQMTHDLLLTDYYYELNNRTKIAAFYKEFTKIDGIRPDAFVAYTESYQNKLAFIEIEISNKGLDLEKYYRAYTLGDYRRVLPAFPKIVVITNKNYKNTTPLNVEIIKKHIR